MSETCLRHERRYKITGYCIVSLNYLLSHQTESSSLQPNTFETAQCLLRMQVGVVVQHVRRGQEIRDKTVKVVHRVFRLLAASSFHSRI